MGPVIMELDYLLPLGVRLVRHLFPPHKMGLSEKGIIQSLAIPESSSGRSYWCIFLIYSFILYIYINMYIAMRHLFIIHENI